MEKYTLSSLINRVVEIEKELAKLLTGTLDYITDDRLKNILLEYIDGLEERLDRLTRVKIYMVVEMVLEPITGLDTYGYMSRVNDIYHEDNLDISIKILKIFSLVETMYIDIAEKIRYISPELSDELHVFVRNIRRLKDRLD
jgi:hypothetical protein